MREALPLLLPTCVVGMSFGATAMAFGWGPVAPVVMSLLVFSGAAQLAGVVVLGAGAGLPAAVLTAALVGSRFLVMGAAVGPSMRGGRLRRAVEGQALTDASLVLASIGEARFGPRRLLGAAVPIYAGWTLGTLAGVLLGGTVGDPGALGLDVVFPAFFVVLLAGELKDRAARVTAATAAVVALALIPVAPPGLPVLCACAAVLAGRLAAS